MNFLTFLVLVLSTWRITHLVVEDQIPLVKKPREWITNRNPEGNLAYLVDCIWCSSVWVAAAHIGALYIWQDSVPQPFALAAALSAGAALFETLTQYLDDRMSRA